VSIRTGIFGGSFNPVHNGHIALAKQLLELAELDEVWFMVSPQNPLKHEDELLDDGLRLQMVQLALAGEPRLKACDYEFGLPRPSYTWNTLQAMERDYPEHSFTLLIGGDNWEHFGRWYRHEDIVRRYPIVVYPRSGSPLDPSTLPQGVRLVTTQLIDLSSTGIRRMIADGQPITEKVPAAVADYIARRHLYE
jgi:nicotinate-nucleotide adenylyltransferase